MNVTAYIGAGPPTPDRGWVYDYQTLITGLLALAAAIITVVIARGQLRAQRQQLQDARNQVVRDRAARLRAARASLPAVLSAICDYAEATGRALQKVWPTAALLYPEDVNPLTAHLITVRIEPFPSVTLQSLERVVELTDNEVIAERIESILREAQVLGARTRKLATGDEIGTNLLSAYILQAASIYARAESLFEYARRQSDGPATEPLWNRVFAALSIFGVHQEEVLEMARRERDNSLPPGEADTRPAY